MRELVDFIKRHRLEEPVQWMLEAHRPMRALAYNSLLLAQPAATFLGLGVPVKSLLESLESPEALKDFEDRIAGAQALACDNNPNGARSSSGAQSSGGAQALACDIQNP